MNKYRSFLFRKIFSFAILGCVLSAQSQNIPSLNQYLSNKPDWMNDKSEIGYVSLRCVSLFSLLGHYFTTRADGDARAKVQGDIFLSKSNDTLLVTLFFGELNGYKQEDILRRGSLISKEYTNIMSSNKDLNNSIFEGSNLIKHDLNVCDNIQPFFNQFSNELKDLANQSHK